MTTASNTAPAPQAAAPDRVPRTATERQLGGVRLRPLTQRPMSGGLKVNGVRDVPPENLVSVSAPLGGFMDRADLLQGSRVCAGHELAPAFCHRRRVLLARQA